MKKLEIDKDRMLKAAEECPKVKKFCKTMWPEWVDVTRECTIELGNRWWFISHEGVHIGTFQDEGPFIWPSHPKYKRKQGEEDGETGGRHAFRILKRK